MASTHGPVQLAGDFKNLYKDSGLVEATPTWAVVQDRYKFEEAESTGAYYIFGISLQKENGFTYAPSSGVNSGPQTLNASVAGYIAQVQVEGFCIYLRSRLSYDAAAKASRAGKKAFVQAYGAIIKNMKESHQYRLELSLLYGRSGLGVLSANASGQTFTIAAAYWAVGIWAAGMKDCPLDIYTTTAASATAHATNVVITAVNIATRTITVSGDITAAVTGDVVYFLGARTATGWNECAGLYAILTNTGTLFNVSATTYDTWKSQTYAAGGNLSFSVAMQAAALGMSYGLSNGLTLVAPEKFAQLGIEESALRSYTSDSDAKRTKRGVKSVGYQLGTVDISIMPHPFIWQGFPMTLPDDEVHRIGATDITFGLPGSDEKMEVHVQDVTALEIRSMSDQALYIEKPAQAILITGVT